MVEPYLVVCGLLLLGSVLARGLPTQRVSYDDHYEDGWDLSPRELAYLRRGRYGVVLTVLAEMHGAGVVDLGSSGRICQLDPPRHYDDPLVTTIYAGLNWFQRPRLLAQLPSVRRSCREIRSNLVDQALLASARRRVFGDALLAFAVGLALATMLERAAEGSTVSSAALVSMVGTALGLIPNRTVAGYRELQLHRRCLRRVIAAGTANESYLADIVAADGWPAVQVLCGSYVAVGALAPVDEPATAAKPMMVPVPPVLELPTGWRRSIYETVSDGPPITVRRAFVTASQRIQSTVDGRLAA